MAPKAAVQYGSDLFFATYGFFGLNNVGENLREANRSVIQHFDLQRTLFIPKAILYIILSRFGGGLLGGMVSNYSLALGNLITKYNVPIMAGFLFALEIINGEIDIPPLYNLEPQNIQNTMKALQGMFDQENDSYLNLLDFVSENRDLIVQKMLLPKHKELKQKFPFVGRMLLKQGSYANAISQLQQNL